MLIMFKIRCNSIFIAVKYSILRLFMFYNIKVLTRVFRNTVCFCLFLCRCSK
jgi:hypothetical protein